MAVLVMLCVMADGDMAVIGNMHGSVLRQGELRRQQQQNHGYLRKFPKSHER